ncbi:MAG: 4a-hydroxytetrahydrobiopterin dehydratase [Actinobacteria bacterium]|nr:4a-hydroxytetrahydrobiopterin dehydratase [Actinomycetota bacterium]
MPTELPPESIAAQLARLTDWARVGDVLVRVVVFDDFISGIEAVNGVAAAAEAIDHHPDIDIRWREVTFRCTTHSAGAITDLDVELAERIDAVVAQVAGGRG